MVDLTKYGPSPYAVGSPKRGEQVQGTLASLLRGVLGQEEPGSVLDPATAGYKDLNKKANLASILSDLIPGKGATGLAPAMAGALRRGGRKDLFLSHGANAGSLMQNGKLISELTHPSMAITKDAPKAPWGDVMFIPREGKFDPRSSPAALHDMDAWTQSWNNNTTTNPQMRNAFNDEYERKLMGAMMSPRYESPGTLSPVKPGFITNDAQARLVDKFASRFEKGGANSTGGGEAMGVNRFPSFEAYENAVRGGVKRLEGGKPIAQKHLDWLEDTANANGVSKPELLEDLLTQDTLGHGEVGRDYARKVVKSLRQTPADYAELKVFGHVPLTADNFAGVMAREGTSPELLNALRERGLQVTEYLPSGSASEIGHYANELQRLSREAMTPVPGSRGIEPLPQDMPYDKVVEALRQKKIKAGYAAEGLSPSGTAKQAWQQHPKGFETWDPAAQENWLNFNKIDPNGAALDTPWGEVLGKKKLMAEAEKLWPDMPKGPFAEGWLDDAMQTPGEIAGDAAVAEKMAAMPATVTNKDGKNVMQLLSEGHTFNDIMKMPGFEYLNDFYK